MDITVDWKNPENLHKLLTYSNDELRKEFYWLGWESIRRQRSKQKKLIKEGKIAMPTGSPESSPERKVLEEHGLDASDGAAISYHVGYIKNAEGEIEYTKPLPSVRNQRPKQQISDFISQAEPVKIRSSRRKIPVRDHKLLLAYGDSQIEYRQIDGVYVPIHDERALRVVRLMCQEYMPDVIVNLGDTVDLASLSRFQADSDHFRHSLNPAFNRVHQMYAELRADNPQAEIHEVDSNHNARLGKLVLKQVPELYGIRQAGTDSDNYPTLTYPFFANLDAVGVTWHGGYGAAEYVYGEEYDAPPIVFKHGVSVVSNGSTAAKESKENPEVHIVRGHGHRNEVHHRTTRGGRILASIMVGCTCRIDGYVPSYHSAVDDMGRPVKTQENWQQSVLLITDYQNGHYQFDNVNIHDGIAFYRGKEFDGNE